MSMNRITARTAVTVFHRNSGFTLMEVLITVVVMSIGLLGLAGLQFNSIRSGQSASQSTLAAMQVLDAADRLRGNPAGVAAGNYNLLTGASGDPGCIGTAGGCGTAALAQYDDWAWNAANAQLLPSGQGVICLDSTPGDGTSAAAHGCDGAQTSGLNVFAITVWWDDDRDPSTPDRRHFLSVIP